MTEYEKRGVYHQMLEAMKGMAAIGGSTTDKQILEWVEDSMNECINLMQVKCGRSNDYPLKVFKVLRDKKAFGKALTNADIAQNVGLSENSVRVILKETGIK